MTTDIDRKLAIYYHPLFQEIIKRVIDLFNAGENSLQIGLLQFLEFNLKLQKALLPTFEKENALISGLNDWVKQVAECLTYEGMVSTKRCVDITSQNFVTVLQREMQEMQIPLFAPNDIYISNMVKLSSHDAFKLLGVRINKEVFSKFMFDLCSTWCQFLDVQLFSYFLLGIYIQISQGDTLQHSHFRKTHQIQAVDLDFMEEFQTLKSNYHRNRKKQLRYYRAWCEWNYLRVNQIGQALILQLDQTHPQDNRILQIALVFEKAIQTINNQITNQNPVQLEQKSQNTIEKQQESHKDKEFLILKKIDIGPSKGVTQSFRHQQLPKEQHKPMKEYYEEQIIQQDEYQHDFQIQIDEEGNMYLKRVVKLPVFGVKIHPSAFENKENLQRLYLDRKKQQMREVSNLYKKMSAMKVRLQHDAKRDPYAFKKNLAIIQRDAFYQKKDQKNKIINIQKQMNRTIHDRMKPQPTHSSEVQLKQKKYQEIKRKVSKNNQSIRENHDYIHKVIAPPFLTDSAYNAEYSMKEGNIYGNEVGSEKRELKIGLPKIDKIDKFDMRVKAISSYHYVGKLVNNRQKINSRVNSISNYDTTADNKSLVERLKEENQFVVKRYIEEDELRELTNYEQFYKKLEMAKRKFGQEFQSEYRKNLKPILLYENRRHELGGVITEKDHQRFYTRMERLIKKNERRVNRRKRKDKNRRYKSVFKKQNDKTLYEDIFLNYHRDAIKSIKQSRNVLSNN